VGERTESTNIRRNWWEKMTNKSHFETHGILKTKTLKKQAVRQEFPGKKPENHETVFGVQPFTAPPRLELVYSIEDLI
jgi:hypothetical protein